eukprot:3940659-Rhodomonas_salina.3
MGRQRRQNPSSLRTCYAMSGTDTAYAAVGLCTCYALSGTDIAYAATVQRACYAMPGTDLACAAVPVMEGHGVDY